MRFLRVIRLDESDRQVYARLATPGEWAVPGAFAFLVADIDRLEGKLRQAFRHGFLGTESFGWSTLVEVDEIGDAEYEAVIERLAAHFVQHYGAPDLEAARVMARDEAAFAASLCTHDVHTLLALERGLDEEGIVENFRVVPPPDGLDHSKIRFWAVDDG